MPPQTTFPLYDQLLNGRLSDLLTAWRSDEGLSFYDISVRLADRGVRVTPETVRRWCLQQNIDKAEAG